MGRFPRPLDANVSWRMNERVYTARMQSLHRQQPQAQALLASGMPTVVVVARVRCARAPYAYITRPTCKAHMCGNSIHIRPAYKVCSSIHIRPAYTYIYIYIYMCNPGHRISRPRGTGSVGGSVGEGRVVH